MIDVKTATVVYQILNDYKNKEIPAAQQAIEEVCDAIGLHDEYLYVYGAIDGYEANTILKTGIMPSNIEVNNYIEDAVKSFRENY